MRINLRHIIFSVFLLCLSLTTFAKVQGIYVTQTSLEDTGYLGYLIKHAKASGIDTFVIDFDKLTKAYQKNIEMVKANNLRYVARIVMFPGGANRAQMLSEAYREKKFNLIKQAIALGAQAIQLDYIRYASSVKPEPRNEQDVLNVIKWYRTRLNAMKIPLQVDIFGITSFRPEKRIGQNAKSIATLVDALCPMNYPSHFDPYIPHSQHPYDTIYSSMSALKNQIKDNQRPIKIYNYIEMSNYRYPLSHAKKMDYIRAEIKATHDSNADGWYAWSPNNKYDNLFTILKAQQQNKTAANPNSNT